MLPLALKVVKSRLDSLDILFFIALFLPAFLAFRAFFQETPLVWGDAPFFYPERLRELVAEPYSWTSWGENFGSLDKRLWLYPLMLLYGVMHILFGFDNDLVIRLLFYFPAVILSFSTPVFFTRYLGYSKIVQFFSVLLYGLNTYFLLLVDGGQVGVSLAYGLFPLALLFLRRVIDNTTLQQFFISLSVFMLLVITDFRIAIVAVIAILVWLLFELYPCSARVYFGRIRVLIPFLFGVLMLSSYWVVPTLRLVLRSLNVDVANQQFLSILNSLLLFQPHWPQNEFGKISSPPFYFVVLPLLIFGMLLVKKERRNLVFAFCFLVFAFLVKGGSEPLGAWYSWLVSNTTFGFAFRDSTKFFAPLILFAGVLIGTTIEYLTRVRYLTPLGKGVTFSIYLYLLFLVHPALLGNLNGVLSGRGFTEDFNLVYQNLRDDPGPFRTLWFPERHPFSFHTEEKPALDAKDLVDLRPFASMNVGTFDRFNFLHNEQFIDWFNLLGVRYLVFSGDWRKNELDIKEQQSWNVLLDLVGSFKGLEKVDWETKFSIFKAPSIKPRIFMVDKLIVVVGGDDVYQRLRAVDNNFSVGNQGFVFVEDGNVNFSGLDGIKPDSLVLLFNGEGRGVNLTMSFLQEYFVSPQDSANSEWAIRSTEDYLLWKYELLTNGIESREFDYQKGVAFSTVAGEEISFNLKVLKKDDYYLVVRGMTRMGDRPITVSFNGVTLDAEFTGENSFAWFVKGPVNLDSGSYSLVLKNPKGFQVVNTVALIPKKDWDLAMGKYEDFITRFESVSLKNDALDLGKLKHIASLGSWSEVGYEQVNPTRYRVNLPAGPQWIVFSDRYHTGWQLIRDNHVSPSQPFYSAINGFYKLYDWDRSEIVFAGQDDVRWGVYYSVLTVIVLAITFFWFYPGRNGQHFNGPS